MFLQQPDAGGFFFFWFLLGNSRPKEILFLGFPTGPTESGASILVTTVRRDHDDTRDDRGEKKASGAASSGPASAFHYTVRLDKASREFSSLHLTSQSDVLFSDGWLCLWWIRGGFEATADLGESPPGAR